MTRHGGRGSTRAAADVEVRPPLSILVAYRYRQPSTVCRWAFDVECWQFFSPHTLTHSPATLRRALLTAELWAGSFGRGSRAAPAAHPPIARIPSS